MENNGNQNLASTLCKAGCGFFGSHQFDGMCSKCFKDSLKRKQASTEPAAISSTPRVPNTTPSIETALPTVPTVTKNDTVMGVDSDACSSGASSSVDTDNQESPCKTKKRNRCNTCNKKVGLTGFECRCGGLFCSIHRYSDKHACEFNYKEHGADHIRKNNPVVMSEKVQKL